MRLWLFGIYLLWEVVAVVILYDYLLWEGDDAVVTVVRLWLFGVYNVAVVRLWLHNYVSCRRL